MSSCMGYKIPSKLPKIFRKIFLSKKIIFSKRKILEEILSNSEKWLKHFFLIS
jgi:hypothetical protein